MKKVANTTQIRRFLFSLTLLLENGFELKESLAIMRRSQQLPQRLLVRFEEGLVQGSSIAHAFKQLGCTKKEVTQIQFALIHGNLVNTLQTLLSQRIQREKQLTLFRKASTYPAILLIAISFVLLILRQYLLPQLLAAHLLFRDHWGVQFILYLPFYLLGVGLIISFLFGYYRYYVRVHSKLQHARFLSRLPFFHVWYRLYQTSYFTLEWGNLYSQGLESQQIVTCMLQLSSDTLMYEVAQEMEKGFAQGKSFAELVKEYPFLAPELPTIIYQGELAGRLGEELKLYSHLTLVRLSEKLERGFYWIQPVLFLVVAGLVISIYAAMFIPLYENMGGALV